MTGQLNMIWAIAVVTYKEWFAYRTHSLVSAFTGPAHFLIMASIWRAVYAGAESIGGMRLEDMLAYYGVTMLITLITMDSADWNLQMLVRTGKYLTFALRPLHHRLFALSQKIGHRFLGLLFELLPVYLIYTFVFKQKLQPSNWGYFLASVALAYLMEFYINYSIGLISFWLVNTGGIRMVFHLLAYTCSGALFPLTLLPAPIQRIVFFLPFQFTVYLPGKMYSGGYSLGVFSMGMPQALAVQALYTICFWWFSEMLYRAGMKRFSAVGA
ncbi:MAG: ABC-2 family transporter protein [Clostridiales bacterium]|nr:ABC-2 family transporter protein [Clostridiales bacterium]